MDIGVICCCEITSKLNGLGHSELKMPCKRKVPNLIPDAATNNYRDPDFFAASF